MNICLDISRCLLVLNSLFAYTMLFESRLSKRMTILSVVGAAVVLIIINVGGARVLGTERIIQMLTFTFTLPSMGFFFAISRHRGARFFFTFFATHVLGLWVTSITSLMNMLSGDWKYVLMLFTRIVIFAIMDLYVFLRLRKDYQIALQLLKKGWLGITLICILFRLLILSSSTYPTPIWTRPQELMSYILMMTVIPFVLYTLLNMITRQMNMQRLQAQQKNLRVQLEAMSRQIVGMAESDKRMRIYRHDVRHHIHQLTYMIKAKDYDAALRLLTQYGQQLSLLETKRYCENSTVNAMLSYYLQQAESIGIRAQTSLNIPSGVEDAIDLSILLANLIENAINACKALPEADRWMRVACTISGDQLTLEIANPYKGEVRFDEDGLPVNAEDDHGIGSHSVAAFARKHGLQWDFSADGRTFRVRLLVG